MPDEQPLIRPTCRDETDGSVRTRLVSTRPAAPEAIGSSSTHRAELPVDEISPSGGRTRSFVRPDPAASAA